MTSKGRGDEVTPIVTGDGSGAAIVFATGGGVGSGSFSIPVGTDRATGNVSRGAQ